MVKAIVHFSEDNGMRQRRALELVKPFWTRTMMFPTTIIVYMLSTRMVHRRSRMFQDDAHIESSANNRSRKASHGLCFVSYKCRKLSQIGASSIVQYDEHSASLFSFVIRGDFIVFGFFRCMALSCSM